MSGKGFRRLVLKIGGAETDAVEPFKSAARESKGHLHGLLAVAKDRSDSLVAAQLAAHPAETACQAAEAITSPRTEGLLANSLPAVEYFVSVELVAAHPDADKEGLGRRFRDRLRGRPEVREALGPILERSIVNGFAVGCAICNEPADDPSLLARPASALTAWSEGLARSEMAAFHAERVWAQWTICFDAVWKNLCESKRTWWMLQTVGNDDVEQFLATCDELSVAKSKKDRGDIERIARAHLAWGYALYASHTQEVSDAFDEQFGLLAFRELQRTGDAIDSMTRFGERPNDEADRPGRD